MGEEAAPIELDGEGFGSNAQSGDEENNVFETFDQNEKCRCCKKWPRCQAFWSNTYVRIATVLISLGILAWIIYIIWAYFELMKVSKSVSAVATLNIADLCSYSVPFGLTVNISNPSSFGLSLNSAQVAFALGDGPYMAKSSFKPTFQGSGKKLQSGDNVMVVKDNIEILNVQEVGNTLSRVLSDVKKIPLRYKLTMSITFTGFGFPVTTSVTTKDVLYLNDPDAEAEEAAKNPNTPPAEEAPPPTLLELQLLPRAITGGPNSGSLDPNFADGMYAATNWSVWSWMSGVNISIPRLVLRVEKDNVTLADAVVHPGFYSWQGRITADADVPPPSGLATAVLRQIVTYYQTSQNFTLNFKGTNQSTLSTDAACMAQDAVNLMEKASVLVVSRSTSAIVGNGTTGGEKENATLEVTQVAVHSLYRNKPGATSSPYVLDLPTNANSNIPSTLSVGTGAYVKMNIPFSLWGSFPDIYMDIYSRGQLLAYAKVSSFALYPDQIGGGTWIKSWVVVLDETLAYHSAAEYTSFDALELSIQGRGGENFISDILGGYNYNFSVPKNTPTTPSPPSAPTELPRWFFSIKLLDLPNIFFSETIGVIRDVTSSIAVLVPPLQLNVSNAISTADALGFGLDAVAVGWNENVSINANVSFDLPEGDVLGNLLDDFLQKRPFLPRIYSPPAGSPTYADLPLTESTLSSLPPMAIDLYCDFTYDDVFYDSGPSSSTGATTGTSSRGLDLGPVLLQSMRLDRLTRDELSAFLALNLSAQLDLGPHFDVYGDLPAVTIDLHRESDNLRLLTVQNSPLSLPPSGGNLTSPLSTLSTPKSFPLRTTFLTTAEQELLDTISDASDTPQNLVIRGGSASPSPLSNVIDGLTINITVGSNKTTSTPSTSSSSASKWNVLNVTVNSDVNTIYADAATIIPELSLPMELYIGQLLIDIDYIPRAAPLLRIVNFTAPEMLLCDQDCPNYLAATLISDGSADGGDALAQFVYDLLNDNTTYPIRIHGNAGEAVIDIYYNITLSTTQSQFIDKAANDLRSNLGDSTRAADSGYGVQVNAINLNGTGVEGETIIIPCVLPFSVFPLCPLDASRLTGTNIQTVANVSLPNPTKSFPINIPLNISLPELEFEVACCIYTPMARITISPLQYIVGAFDDNPRGTVFTVLLQPLDLSLVQEAANSIQDSDIDFSFRLHGSRAVDANLLSTILRYHETLLTIEKTVNISAPPPVTTEKNNGSLNYWLTHTSPISAAFAMEANFDSPLTFPWLMGDVELLALYTGIQFANANLRADFYPGLNRVRGDLNFTGETVLSPRCANSNLTNPQFCVPNEVVSRILQSDEFPNGTDLTVVANFIGYEGQPLSLQVDAVVFVQRPSTRPKYQIGVQRIAKTKEANSSLIDDAGVDFENTAWAAIDSIFGASSDFTAKAWIDVRNIFNFTVTINRVKLDLYQHDWEGVHNYYEYPGIGGYGPRYMALIADNIEKTWSKALTPDELARVNVDVYVDWSGAIQLGTRLFDDYYIQGYLCAHMLQGSVTMTLLGPTGTNLTYTQIFNLYDVSAVGSDACAQPVNCTANYVDVFTPQGPMRRYEPNFVYVPNRYYPIAANEVTVGLTETQCTQACAAKTGYTCLSVTYTGNSCSFYNSKDQSLLVVSSNTNFWYRQEIFALNDNSRLVALTSPAGFFKMTLVINDDFWPPYRGSAWRIWKVPVLEQWMVTFTFRCIEGTLAGGNADGIVFVLQANPAGLAAIGRREDGNTIAHGYKGMNNSIAVVFDVYGANEVMVLRNGDTGYRVSNSEKALTIHNGGLRTVRLRYNPVSQKLDVFVDGNYITIATIDLSTVTIWDSTPGFPSAYMGFTASTGTLAYSQFDVNYMAFATVTTQASQCFVVEKGRVRGVVGKQGWFTIDARDSCGEPRVTGGDTWSLTLLHQTSPPRSVDRVDDLLNGLYRVFFTVPATGNWTVRVTSVTTHALGSTAIYASNAPNIGFFVVQ